MFPIVFNGILRPALQLMNQNKRLVLIGSFLLVAAWGIWCAFFLAKGLDFTDEGMYCADAWRLAHGDLLFRDTLATNGLSPWFLSLVFHVDPGCGLLGLRIVWAIVMLLCAFATANIMLRYFNPAVSFTGATAGLFFATGGAIKILSYISMPILGLILATCLWLAACRQNGKTQLLLAGGAGVAAFLATTCRIALFPVLLLPFVTLAYDFCCGVKMNGRLRSTIAFSVTYLVGLACFFLFLGVFGLLGDMSRGLAAISSSKPGYSLTDMVHNAVTSSFYLLSGALIVLIPALLIKIGKTTVFSKKRRSAIIHAMFATVVLCLFIVMLEWESRALGIQPLASLGLGAWIVYGLAISVALIAVMFFTRRRDILVILAKQKRAIGYAVPALLFCLLVAFLVRSNLYDLVNWFLRVLHRAARIDFTDAQNSYWLIIGLAIGIILMVVISHMFDSSTKTSEDMAHDKYRLALIALFLSFLMILGTANVPALSVRDISWLPVSVAVGFSWLWVKKQTRNSIGPCSFWLPRAALVALLLLIASFGLLADRFPYRSGSIGEQVAVPATPKLSGILTTSDRAYTVDRLVKAIDLYSKPGGRILAYEHLPMLYYLANRLPSTNTSWVTPTFDKSLREAILEDMISRGRTPQLVVRATYTTVDPRWPTVRSPIAWGQNQQETDPIDKWVREHYKTIEEIDGFQIMLPKE